MSKTRKKEQKKSREEHLLERLREHPELFERFEAILGLGDVGDGALRSADEVEEDLIEEVRKLGNQVMGDWAQGTEKRAAEQLLEREPNARVKKRSR